MGKGYYFNMESEVKARRAANTFLVTAIRRFHVKGQKTGLTKTTGGRYVSSVDICGKPDERLADLAKEITEAVDNGK